MKIWVDDRRPPPDNGWIWSLGSEGTIIIMQFLKREGIAFEKMSLDHDLGGEDTTRPVVLWMCDADFWPDECLVHSANPVGREWLEGMIDRYMNHTEAENLEWDSDWRYDNWDYDG